MSRSEAVSFNERLGIDRRFQVMRLLGGGAASQVYEVRDQLHSVPRALKIATRRGWVRKLKTEYARLAELRHPHIVRSYDFGISDGGLPYYTQELVHGVSLQEVETRRDPALLALLALQILDALATIHARGWVHRDIKPKNILVVGRSTASLVRLIDLGLMAPAGRAAPPGGTLPYVAPEVARGEPADGRADLYSLGVMLYEALLPEEAPRTVQEVVRRFSHSPPPPHVIEPSIPLRFSELIMQLLSPMPRDRPPDADAAAEALCRVAELRLGRGPGLAMAERLLRGGAVSHRPRAIQQVRRWARQKLAAAEGGLAVVSGDVGVGKTPFLRELATVLCLQGYRVLQLRASNQSGTPIPALLAAAKALSSRPIELPASERISMVRDGGPATTAAFAGQIAATLTRALGDRPTVVLIDDLHRAEPSALEVLRAMGAEVRKAPLLLICAADPRPDAAPLADVLEDTALTIRLAPLRESQVARLAAHRLHGLQIPPPALKRLTRDSQGMPSLVERTLARLVVDKTVVREGDRFLFAGGRYRFARHEDPELIAARLAQVSPELRKVLNAAAVLGHGLNAATVAPVANISKVAASQALAELARLQLLNAGEATTEPSYLFTSRSLRNTVYQEIPNPERRSLHDRAAAVARSDEGGGRLEEQTEHLLKGSDDQRAIEAAMEAGRRAASVYADRRAIEYYARAFSRLSGAEHPLAPRIALELGRCFERIGELERASVWFRAAIEAVTDPSPEGEALEILLEATLGEGAVAWMQGHPEVTVAHADEVLARGQGPALVTYRARAKRLQAVVAMHRGAAGEAERLLTHAAGALGEAGAEPQMVEVLLDLSRLARHRGALLESVRHARKALSHARRSGEPAAVAEAYTLLGRGFLQASRFSAARRSFSRGLRVARQSGDRLREASVLREIGNLRVRQADLNGALERYNRSLELVRAVRARSEEARCLHNLGVVNMLMGHFRPSLAAFHAALDVANDIGDAQVAPHIYLELGHAYCELGALEQSRDALHAALRNRERPTGAAAEAQALLAWVEASLGDTTGARQRCKTVLEGVAALEDPATRALCLLYCGYCCVQLADIAGVETTAERLMYEVSEGVLGDFEAAARGLQGMGWCLQGCYAAGLEALDEAASMSRGQGMRPLEVRLHSWAGRSALSEAELASSAARHLTRAMEVARDIARELPPEYARVFLQAPERETLRAAFRGVYEQIMEGRSAEREVSPS